MILYILMALVTIVFAMMGVFSVSMNNEQLHTKVNIRNLKICNAFGMGGLFFMFFLTACRAHSIGNDTETYVRYFNAIKEMGINHRYQIELGYQYINLLIAKITKNENFFLVIISSIVYMGIGRYIYKYSKNVLISVCLFFCLFFSSFTSMVRQSLAMVIGLFAYQMLKEKRYVQFAILVVIAAFIHKSALVLLLLLLYKWIPYRCKYIYGIAGVIAVLSASGILNEILIMVLPEYQYYFSSVYASSGWLAVSFAVLRAFFLYWMAFDSCKENLKESKLILCVFGMLLLCCSFGYSVNLFVRASEYFLLIGIVEIPNMFYERKVKNYRIKEIAVCSFLVCYFILVLIYRPEWNRIYPYNFWWN